MVLGLSFRPLQVISRTSLNRQKRCALPTASHALKLTLQCLLPPNCDSLALHHPPFSCARCNFRVLAYFACRYLINSCVIAADTNRGLSCRRPSRSFTHVLRLTPRSLSRFAIAITAQN